jgi:hypothetical protein
MKLRKTWRTRRPTKVNAVMSTSMEIYRRKTKCRLHRMSPNVIMTVSLIDAKF